MLTCTVTEKGYRIQNNGADWIVQEDGYIPYPGKTMAESAANHMAMLEGQLSLEERLEKLELDEKRNSSKVDALSDRQDFTEDCIAEIAGAVYV